MSVYLTPKMQNQRISHTWMTKIQENIEGGEKRSAIFTWPRVKLDSKIQFVEDEERRFIHTHLYRDIHNIWSIPIISDETKLTAQSASGQKIITVAETDYRHFYDGRDCILIDPDDWESYEKATIATVDSSTQITVSVNLTSTWPIGTLIFPLYDCRIQPEQTITSRFHEVNNMTIIGSESFESVRSFSYTLPTVDAGIYPTYNSLSLFLTRPMNPISEKWRHPYELFGTFGLQTSFTNYGDTRGIFSRIFQLTTKKEIYDLFDFFDAQMGRLCTFYVPTWLDDIVIDDGFLSTDTNLTIKKRYLTSGEISGRYVYIQFPDKSYVCRRIISSTTDTSMRIDALGTTVATADLSKVLCCFLYEARFNIDEMAVDYIRNPIAKIKLSFNTLPFPDYTPPSWLGTYAHRRKITIDNTNIDSDLIHFPGALVLGTSVGQSSQNVSDIFDEVGANYLKIAITKSDGITQIYGDVEFWDNGTENAVIHIAKSDLSILSANVTELYIYYDSAQADNTDYIGLSGTTAAQSAWDSDFEAVYHMAQDPSGGVDCVLDSTSNGNDLTPGGTMTSGDLVDAEIGKGIEFDGIDDFMQAAHPALDILTSGLTLEAIIKANSATMVLFQKQNVLASSSVSGYALYTRTSDPYLRMVVTDAPEYAHQAVSADDPCDNTYKHVAGRWDISTHTVTSFVSDVKQGETVNASVVDLTNAANFEIGRSYNNGSPSTFYAGILSEVRVSKTDRSEAWRKATKYSMKDDLITFNATENY